MEVSPLVIEHNKSATQNWPDHFLPMGIAFFHNFQFLKWGILLTYVIITKVIFYFLPTIILKNETKFKMGIRDGHFFFSSWYGHKKKRPLISRTQKDHLPEYPEYKTPLVTKKFLVFTRVGLVFGNFFHKKIVFFLIFFENFEKNLFFLLQNLVTFWETKFKKKCFYNFFSKKLICFFFTAELSYFFGTQNSKKLFF